MTHITTPSHRDLAAPLKPASVAKGDQPVQAAAA
jgi:hypothetical protein